ncbi:hypothetical protein KP509_25G034100 [Ceratopteris richardii]|uniref:Uncharacterized protein n=1 Tax=Ceratopteris richardii TaxID=49495 RepID=A0A8T2RQN3_CERRI|nr:hypothetical protein KP509_25G034100 [Ceratopteris richardii]
MENFLMKKGLWGLVNGEDECPELRENLNAKEQDKYKTWIEKSRKVHNGLLAEIRKIVDDLASINCKVKDDDMVSVMLNGVGPQYKSLDTSILVRGIMPDFDELVALCMREEHKERGSSHGRYFPRNANTMDMPRDRGRSNSRGRGRSQAPGNCYHCGNQRGTGRSHYAAYGNFSAESSYRDYGRSDNMFAMEHVLNKALKTKDYVATSDDTLHVINDVGNVSKLKSMEKQMLDI